MDFELEKFTKIYNRNLSQFKDRPRLKALQESYVREYEELESVFAAMHVLRDVDQAYGDALRKLGSLVGEAYKSQTEAVYRIAIKARILANTLHARVEDIYKLYEDCQLHERKTKFTLRSVVAQNYEDAYIAWYYLQRIKGAGIKADYQYAGYEGSEHWQFDVNSQGSEFDYQTLALPETADFCCALNIGGDIWFVPKSGNYWVGIDTSTDTIYSYASSFSGSMAHACYDAVNQCIWAVPDESDYVVKFSLITHQETTYAHSIATEQNMFSYCVIDSTGTYLVGIPYNTAKIMRVTLASGSVSTIDHPGTITCAKCKSGIAQGDYVYTVPYNASQIVRFKPSDMSYTGWSHGESGSALYCNVVYNRGYLFYTPYNADNFMHVQVSTMSISKNSWYGKQIDDFMCGSFLVGDRLIHVPGKHSHWLEQETSSPFAIVDKYKHPLDEEIVCAQYATQNIDKTITGFASNIDQYMIRFDPMDNSIRKTLVPFQHTGSSFYNTGIADSAENGNLYWAPNGRDYITKMNWSGAYGARLTELVKLKENQWADGDCEASNTSSWSCPGTLWKDTTIKKSGSRSLKIQSSGTLGYLNNENDLEVGEKYHVSFWIYTENTNFDYLRLRDGGTVIYSTSIPLGVWRKINYTYVAFDAILYIWPILSATTIYYIDECRITKIS